MTNHNQGVTHAIAAGNAVAMARHNCGVAIAVIFNVGFDFNPNAKIDRTSFDRIQKGMDEAEVEGILGPPPGDLSVGDRVLVLGLYEGGFIWMDEHAMITEWWSNEGVIQVGFGLDKNVRSCRFFDIGLPNITMWERFGNWLTQLIPV
jgi:hypothetical protein